MISEKRTEINLVAKVNDQTGSQVAMHEVPALFIFCFGIQALSSEPLSFEVTISPISKEYLSISESKVKDMFTWVDPSCSTIGYQLFAD